MLSHAILNKPLIAIILMCLGMGLIPLNDALIRLMGERLSLFEIMSLRSMISLTILCFIPSLWVQMRKLSLKLFLLLVIRSTLLVNALFILFVSLTVLTMAQAVPVFFLSPFLITLASPFVLGEHLGWRRLFAVLVGFIGVILIVKPNSDDFSYIYILPFISAFSYASFQIFTRYVSKRVNLAQMVGTQQLSYLFWGVMGGLVAFLFFDDYVGISKPLAFLLRDWVMPTTQEIIFIVLCSCLVLFLSFVSANAYRVCEASYAAPFEYVALPMAVFWGFMIWGDHPDIIGFLGIFMILSAGLFLLYCEYMGKPNKIDDV